MAATPATRPSDTAGEAANHPTTTTTTKCADEDDAFVWEHIPSEDELAQSASAAYVRSLFDSLRRQESFTNEMTARIDRLTQERHEELDSLRSTVQQQATEIDELRRRLTQAALQLQEERERSARLLHENTVLYVQDAEQRERLSGLEACCRARGRRIQQMNNGGKSGNSGERATRGPCTTLAGKKKNKNVNSATRPNIQKERGCCTTTMTREDNGESAISLSIRAATRNTLSTLDLNAPPPFTITTSSKSVGCESDALHKASETFLRAAASNTTHVAQEGNMELPSTYPYSASQAVQHNKLTDMNKVQGEEVEEEVEEDVDVARALVPRPATSAAHILALTEEVQALREMLEEQRRLYEEARQDSLQKYNDVIEERRTSDAAYALRIAHLEQLHECSLRDLVTYRHQAERELRALRARVDWLRRSLQEALLVAEEATRRPCTAASSSALLEKWLAQHYRPHVRRLQSALVQRRCTSVQRVRQYETALQDKQREVDALQACVQEQRELRRRAEARHRLEMTGVRSELDQMRQTMRQLEKKVYFARLRDSAEEELMQHCHCD